MTSSTELAALVALLQGTQRPWHEHAEELERQGSAIPLLEAEHGLLAADMLETALTTVREWETDGLLPITLLDAEYPDNLRAVHDRPPLVFLAGRYLEADARSVAVIGSRDATAAGQAAAGSLARHLAATDYTVVSGLARGIDAAAHREAMGAGGRTIAVIGTGLRRVYPPEHAELQRQIAVEGVVVSQFWPDAPPTRRSFPLRNAVMAGLTLATVIVEASQTSGARIQARQALAQGRPVFLRRSLTEQAWARELAQRPGTYVVGSPKEITDALERLATTGPLTA